MNKPSTILSFPKSPPPNEGHIRVVVTYHFSTRELRMNDFAQIRGGKDAGKWMKNPLAEMFGLKAVQADE
jgi:hypothetical protein